MNANRKINVRVYPWNSFKDDFRSCSLQTKDIAFLDPINLPIPLVSTLQWRVCFKISSKAGCIPLGNVKNFAVTRGEINQTVYRKFISKNNKFSRLLKGVEIGRFHFCEKLKQGFREWFDEEAFLKSGKRRAIVQLERVAVQRITGVDERLRVMRPTDGSNARIMNGYANCVSSIARSKRYATIEIGSKGPFCDRVDSISCKCDHAACHVRNVWHRISIDQKHPVWVRAKRNCWLRLDIDDLHDFGRWGLINWLTRCEWWCHASHGDVKRNGIGVSLFKSHGVFQDLKCGVIKSAEYSCKFYTSWRTAGASSCQLFSLFLFLPLLFSETNLKVSAR